MVSASELTPELRSALLAQAEALPDDIKEDAKKKFTVWNKQPNGGYIFCDGFSTLEDATANAREHEQLVDLIILSTNEQHGRYGLTAVADVERTRATYPGSGY